MSDPVRPPVRVLVADDSESMRQALVALLAEDPLIDVVGEAGDGVEAVDLTARLRPDVVTMDVLMPRLDGLGAIGAIMAQTPTRIIVVCDAKEELQTDLSFRAMARGALELVPKPRIERPEELRAWGRRLAETIRLMADVPVVHRRRLSAIPAPEGLGAGQLISIFGIVASTGGPPALAMLLEAVSDADPVPLLIAQHMAPGFTVGLVRWLAEVSRLRVVTAETGMRCQRGHAYLAPDGMDFAVDGKGALEVSPPTGVHVPSGDRLLTSLATEYGGRAGGIVMTGMGDDGARGLLAIQRAGGMTLAQDRASSVVFGMPQAAASLGATQNFLPLETIALMIIKLSKGGSRTIKAPRLA